MAQPELATCQFIVPHPKQAKFMVVKHSDGRWQPPNIPFPADTMPRQHIAELQDALLSNYGLEVTLLRHLQSSPKYHCVEVELRPKGMTRKMNAVWVGTKEYSDFLAKSGQARTGKSRPKDAFERWLEEQSGSAVSAKRRPWEQRGWFNYASDWIHREVLGRGLEVAGSVRQVSGLWRDSAVLSMNTSAGKVFFKASAPEAVNEAQLTKALSEQFPNRVARPLAIHEQLPWMLNLDLGQPNSDELELRDQQQLLFALADLQVKSAANSKDWLAMGVPRISLSATADFLLGIEKLKGFLDGFIKLSDKQFGLLRAHCVQMSILCRDLAQGAVPETLVHPDFNPSNTYRRDNGFWLADWGRSFYGHPFLALFNWSAKFEDDQALSAYFDPFTQFASEKELRDTLDAIRQTVHVRSIHEMVLLLEGMEDTGVSAQNLRRSIHRRINNILNK